MGFVWVFCLQVIVRQRVPLFNERFTMCGSHVVRLDLLKSFVHIGRSR